MSTASKVAEHKRAHPELYCPERNCLWKTNGGRCPRHSVRVAPLPDFTEDNCAWCCNAGCGYCGRCS